MLVAQDIKNSFNTAPWALIDAALRADIPHKHTKIVHVAEDAGS